MRFHHRVDWEDLANGILHAKVGTIIKRYEVGKVYSNPPITELKAVYSGKVEIISGTTIDGYILDDNSAVLSERGTADLLGMDHAALIRVVTNWPPKALESFVDKGWSMRTNLVKVIANNSPYKGREIVVYESKFIESIIRGYTLALASNALRANQKHVGKRCTILACALSKTTIPIAIQQACDFVPQIQKTIQHNYQDVAASIKAQDFKCSVAGDIATKKDIFEFLKIPPSTLNSYLGKHQDTIKPIHLDRVAIRATNSNAPRMNGYHLDDVGKIVLGMDSIIGIDLKQQIFGSSNSLTKLADKQGRDWPKSLARVFAGFTFYTDYPIGGGYTAKFFVKELNLVLEFENGHSAAKEQFICQHYALVYFHHQVDWETLLNGILHAEVGKIIRLGKVGYIHPKTSKPAILEVH